MPHEAAAGVKALRESLISDSQLTDIVSTKIFGESAPQDAILPYVVMRQRSPGADSQVLPDKRAMSSPLFDVGIWVADDPYSTTAQIGAKRIDEDLGSLTADLVTDANGDSYQVSARREGGAWVREEVDAKTMKKFYWVGGSYRLSISAA